jgi:hypothetical protein
LLQHFAVVCSAAHGSAQTGPKDLPTCRVCYVSVAGKNFVHRCDEHLAQKRKK